MENNTQLKKGLKIDSYYGNGTFIGVKTIIRTTKVSVFFDMYGGHRESKNTVENKIKEGLYKIKATVK